MPPFPVSESLLCYLVSTLAHQDLAPSTIKTYLVGHAQIVKCLPEPHLGALKLSEDEPSTSWCTESSGGAGPL